MKSKKIQKKGRKISLSSIIDSYSSNLERDLSLCAHCNVCRDLCPVYLQTFNESDFAGGRARIILSFFKRKIPCDDDFFLNMFFCTTCGQCSTICPLNLDIVKMIEQIRAELNSSTDFNTLKHRKLSLSIAVYHNPYNESIIRRNSWIKPIEQKISHVIKKTADIGYFVGCTAAYRDQESAQNTALILSKLCNNGFTILDSDEFCCGSPVLRTGMPFNSDYVHNNITQIKKKGIKTLVTACAGCYKTICEDWPKLIQQPLPFSILHISEFIQQDLAILKPLLNSWDVRFTYHDPCHLGRFMGVYQAPRDFLAIIPDAEFIEFPNSKNNALCCGAGGGFRMNFPQSSQSLSIRRVNQAKNLGVNVLITSCVFCKYNFLAAENNDSIDDAVHLEIYNIEDVVVKLLKL